MWWTKRRFEFRLRIRVCGIVSCKLHTGLFVHIYVRVYAPTIRIVCRESRFLIFCRRRVKVRVDGWKRKIERVNLLFFLLVQSYIDTRFHYSTIDLCIFTASKLIRTGLLGYWLFDITRLYANSVGTYRSCSVHTGCTRTTD